MSQYQLELVVGGLEVRKVVVVPHPTTNCLHTGWLEGDTESMVVVVGCRDQDASITILSTTLPTRNAFQNREAKRILECNMIFVI